VSVFGQFDGALVNVNVTLPSMEEVAQACRHVLYHLDGDHELGLQPGRFTTLIIEAACQADEMNLAQLALGFPALTTAVSMYKNTPGGIDTIRRLASKAPAVQPDDGFSPKGN